MTQQQITGELIITALKQARTDYGPILPTPYYYQKTNNPICVGDIVTYEGTIDNEPFRETGIVDFIKGCFLFVELNSDPTENPELLYDYYGSLQIYEGIDSIELRNEYLQARSEFITKI